MTYIKYLVNDIDCSIEISYVPSSYDKVFIFQWLHIEIGWVVAGINSESAKVQCPDQEARKFIMVRNFSKVHINDKVI